MPALIEGLAPQDLLEINMFTENQRHAGRDYTVIETDIRRDVNNPDLGYHIYSSRPVNDPVGAGEGRRVRPYNNDAIILEREPNRNVQDLEPGVQYNHVMNNPQLYEGPDKYYNYAARNDWVISTYGNDIARVLDGQSRTTFGPSLGVNNYYPARYKIVIKAQIVFHKPVPITE